MLLTSRVGDKNQSKQESAHTVHHGWLIGFGPDQLTRVAEVSTGLDLYRGSSQAQASGGLSGNKLWRVLKWHATYSFSHLNLQHGHTRSG